MKKRFFKVLAALLTVIIVCSSFSIIPVSAASTAYNSSYDANGKGDGKGIYYHGLDVSKWQGDSLDFAKMKAGGIDFVILRAGYRATTDPQFENNYKKATAAGLDVGAYWYSYALTTAEATDEAVYCAKLLSGKKFEYPIYFDFEDPSQSSLSTSLKRSICQTWMDNIANRGYLVGIYSSLSMLNEINPHQYLSKYETWMARFVGSYSGYADYHSKYGMWQYTESGSVSGYSGNVDRDVAFKDYPSIVKKYGFNNYEPAKQTFTFTFDANGGEGTMSNQTINYGTDTQIKANKFTKEGYTFKGWYAYRKETKQYRYRNLDGEKGWYTKGEQPTGYYRYLYSDQATVSATGLGTGDTVKLTAVWGTVSYKVKYDANGGTGELANTSHVNGVEKTLRLNTFTKSKNTFGGWNLTRSSDGKWLYTQDNGASNSWYLPGSQPDGYRLSVYEDGRLVSKLSGVEGDVVTCYAHWIPKTTGTKTFYIDYNANGGTGTMKRTTVVKGTDTAIRVNTFVRPGYKFAGWRAYRPADNTWRMTNTAGEKMWTTYTERPAGYDKFTLYKDGTTVASTSNVDCEVVTFYAEWTEDFKFTVNYNANGGTGTMSGQTVKYGTATPLNANKFTKDGYKFAGWNVYQNTTDMWLYTNGSTSAFYTKGAQPSGYTLAVFTDQQSISTTGSKYDDVLTMYAVWDFIPVFTFVFDANGGTGTMANQKVEYGVSTNISANTFTKEGYDFKGWNVYREATQLWRYVNADGTAGWYAKGQQPEGYYLSLYTDKKSVSKTGLGTGDTVKLVAVWGAANYAVNYNANGGEGTMSSDALVQGVEKALSKNAFTKTDATFTGWTLTRESDGKSLYTLDGTTVSWYVPGEQPDGYRVAIYKDTQVVSELTTAEGDVVTCTAFWTPVSTGTKMFYVDYNANGATGQMDRTAVVKGNSIKIPTCAFEKPDYKFVGWRAYRSSDDMWRFKNAEGDTMWCKYSEKPEGYDFCLYKDQASIANTSGVDCDIVTFYAVWEEVPIVMGDIDGDGILTVNDATEIQKSLAMMTELSAEQLALCDVNGDGWVDIKDATAIQLMVAGV